MRKNFICVNIARDVHKEIMDVKAEEKIGPAQTKVSLSEFLKKILDFYKSNKAES